MLISPGSTGREGASIPAGAFPLPVGSDASAKMENPHLRADGWVRGSSPCPSAKTFLLPVENQLHRIGKPPSQTKFKLPLEVENTETLFFSLE